MTALAKLRLLWGLDSAVDAAKTAAVEAGVNAKSVWSSKTMWFNLLAGVVGVLQAQGVLTAIPAPWGPVVVMVANIALRYVTTGPVTVLPG